MREYSGLVRLVSDDRERGVIMRRKEKELKRQRSPKLSTHENFCCLERLGPFAEK